MKKYMVPELEVKNFEVEDIIMTSSTGELYYDGTNTPENTSVANETVEYNTLFNLN